MTTLLSWIGVDSRTPSSIYLASDSRISWGSKIQWDVGRKLFASKTMPEIFGYCGDVIFPIQILGQIIEQIDNGVFFSEQEVYPTKLEKIRSAVEDSFRKLPKEHQRPFQILYATRRGSRMELEFFVAKISLDNHHRVISENISLPLKSGLIISAGTGKSSMDNWDFEWSGNIEKDIHTDNKTSRNVFSAFCDSLESRDDLLSGGAPQLVGIYRTGSAKTFGIIHDGKRYLNGLPVESSSLLNEIEWRNRLFERCDGKSMTLLKGAQKQPRPDTIKKPY